MGIVLAFAGIVIISFDPRVFAYWEGLALVGVLIVRQLARPDLPEALEGHPAARGAIVDRARGRLDPAAAEPGPRSRADDCGSQCDVGRVGRARSFTTIMSSLVAHTAWYHLVGRYPVTSLSPMTLLSPLFGIFFGVTLLHDQLTPRMLLGGAVTHRRPDRRDCARSGSSIPGT